MCGLWFVGGGPRGEENGGRERKEKGRIFWRSRFFHNLPSTFYLGLPPAPPEPLPLSKVTKAPKPYLCWQHIFFSGRFFSQHLSLMSHTYSTSLFTTSLSYLSQLPQHLGLGSYSLSGQHQGRMESDTNKQGVHYSDKLIRKLGIP